MPLLRRQPFLKQKTPPGLKDNDEVFVCKLTGEIFLDYEKFFERIILCNSLVWTCELTGKSGLTYQEAIESEEKASKQVATLQDALQKPILYFLSLTHQSRLNDLNDEIYSYVKDRFFLGEVVEVLQRGEKKKCKIIKVIPPTSSQNLNGNAESCASSTTDSDSDVVCLDDPPKPPKSPKGKLTPKKIQEPDPIHPDDFEYVVQEVKKNNIYVVKTELINRKKGAFTREKCKMYLKSNCAASSSGIWKIKEKLVKKFKLLEAKFTDFFAGPPPSFKVSQAKRKPSGSRSGSFIDLTEEDKAIKQAKKEMKQKKKQWKEIKKKEKEEKKREKKENKKKDKEEKKRKKKNEPVAVEEPNFDDLRKMSAEEKLVMKERLKAEKMAARQAQNEENKRKKEEEKQKRKEEREKEREKRKEEKLKRDEYLKEWSKPRDDLECDDLKDLPTAVPIQSHIPTQLFGDAVMVLEHLHCFGSLLGFNEVFQNGISIGEFSKALQDTETNGLFFDILKICLSTLFQLQEEEEEEDEELDVTGLEDEQVLNEEDKTFKDLVKSATIASQWPQLYYSTPLRKLPFDNFTITEILRLHFLSSGAKGSEYNARFRYQQRGAYTPHDDAGLEFRRQEGAILKLLRKSNIFDLSPKDKLKILTAMIHQILTFVASRDMIEDSAERLKGVHYDLRHHRWAEHRRDKEEAAFWYKKRLQDRAKEKELEQQSKEEKKRAKLEKLAQEEGGSKDPEASASKKEEQKEEAKNVQDSPQQEGERHSTRQKEKLNAKQDAEFFDTPVENIQWDKITPEDRVRMKEKYAKRESELMELVNQLQHGSTIAPLGRDRTFRRYWMFRSIPGLFVEDQEEHVPSDYFEPVPQTAPDGKGDGSFPQEPRAPEDKSTSSDKENESFEQGKTSRPATPIKANEPMVNGVVKPVLSENAINGSDEDSESVKQRELPSKLSVHQQISQRNQVCWAYYSTDQVETLIESLNPRGYREGALKATLLEQKLYLLEKMQQMPTDALNLSSEGAEKAEKTVRYQNVKSRNRTMQGAVKNASAQEYLELNLREMLMDIEERIYVGGLGSLKVKNRPDWRDAIQEGSYRPQCDDMSLCGETEASASESINDEIDLTKEDEEGDNDKNPAVKDLAKALLQISRGIDEKYLASPLGEDAETKKQKQKAAVEAAFKGLKTSKKSKGTDKKDQDDSSSESEDEDDKDSIDKRLQKTPRERWEESLLSSSNLSQIFLYLGILEASITWSKSALHARCRICRRKGDGEKMLLCDGCDRGHHMYCLKPAVKKIPMGDWYCPDCRPKDIPKTPRKRRKSVFEESDDDDSDESSEEEEDSSEDEDSSDEDDSDDDSDEDSDEETEEDTEEEEEETTPPPTKIKFIRGNKKQPAQAATEKSKKASAKAPAVAPKTTGRSRRSLETSRPSSRASSQERDRATSKSRKNTITSRQSLENGKSTKHKLEMEERQNKKMSRRSLNIPADSKTKKDGKEEAASQGNSRRSLDSAKANMKRKRAEEEEEDLPIPKKVTSKSRGNEKVTVMKTCENLLHEICEKNEAWPFMKPVSKRDAPDYFDIVKSPMDFATMRNRVNRFEYSKGDQILSDIRLVLKNCEQYNMPTAPEYQAGQKLSRYFEKRVRDLNLPALLAQESPKKGQTAKDKSPSKRSTRQR